MLRMAAGLTYMKAALGVPYLPLIAFCLFTGVLARSTQGLKFGYEQFLQPPQTGSPRVLPVDKLPLASEPKTRARHSNAYVVLVPSEVRDLHPDASQYENYHPRGQSYWSTRTFGHRSLQELGFPAIGSTTENYHYDFNWNDLKQHKRPKRAAAKVPGVIDSLADLVVGESRRNEKRRTEPEPKRDYKGQAQEYDGPYVYTQLFGPPYEIGYIRSPIPSKHVYEDYLQFVRSWSSGAREAVDSGAYKVDNYRGDTSPKDADYQTSKGASYAPNKEDDYKSSKDTDYKTKDDDYVAKPVYSAPKESYDSKSNADSYSTADKGSYKAVESDYKKDTTSAYEAPKASYTENKKNEDTYSKKGDDYGRGSSSESVKPYTDPGKKSDSYEEPAYAPKPSAREPAYETKAPSSDYRENNKGYEQPAAYSALKASSAYSNDGENRNNKNNYDTPSYTESPKAYTETKSYEAPPTYSSKATTYTDDGYSAKETVAAYDTKAKGDYATKSVESSKGSSYTEKYEAPPTYVMSKAAAYEDDGYSRGKATVPAYDNKPKGDSYPSKGSSSYSESSKGSSYTETKSYEAPPTYVMSKGAAYEDDGYSRGKAAVPVYDAKPKEDAYSSKGSSYQEESYSTTPYPALKAVYSTPFYPVKESYDKPSSDGARYDGPSKASVASYDSYDTKAPASTYEEKNTGYQTTSYSSSKTDDGYRGDKYDAPKSSSSYSDSKGYEPAVSKTNYDNKGQSNDDGYGPSRDKSYETSKVTYDEDKAYKAPVAPSAYSDDYSKPKPNNDYKASAASDYSSGPAYEKEYSAPKASSTYDNADTGYKASTDYKANTDDYKAPATYEDKAYTAPKASASYDGDYDAKPYKAPEVATYTEKAYSSGYTNEYKTGSDSAAYSDDYGTSNVKVSSYEDSTDKYAAGSYKADDKDYGTATYSSEVTTKKPLYPVIIGRYQVTDSDAFLPLAVNGGKPSSASKSDGTYVEGGAYTAKGPNDEYVVYYLPYGQPLPVKLRKRSIDSYYTTGYAVPQARNW